MTPNVDDHPAQTSTRDCRTTEQGARGEVVLLRDGAQVFVRPITAQDRRELADAFKRLSPESRYKRFLGAVNELDARTLRYLTEIDHHDHEALAAFDGRDGHGVGIARYVRFQDNPDTAELAVLVADAWQGRGLGTLLVERVVARAQAEGVRRLQALVLATNHAMLRILDEHGWSRCSLPQDGTVEMAFEMPAQDPIPPSSNDGTAPG